jgi:hypothetical protein
MLRSNAPASLRKSMMQRWSERQSSYNQRASQMEFLDRNAAVELGRTYRRLVGTDVQPKLVAYYTSSGKNDYTTAATLISTALGSFNEAVVLFEFAVSLAKSDSYQESDDQWRGYREWRHAAGDDRYPHDAPGHLFRSGETECLAKVIEFALQLGWDAWVYAKPNRHALFLSHDDRLEIYSGCNRRELSAALAKLTYWR